jgi:16S rRNA (uracil1498-N3)-methyltransferase
MKQSLQLHLPQVHATTELKQWVFDADNTQYCFGYCGQANQTPIQNLSLSVSNIVIMIGPEGDFTREETDFLIHHKCVPISLGDTRLRTETAAMYALSVLKSRLGY